MGTAGKIVALNIASADPCSGCRRKFAEWSAYLSCVTSGEASHHDGHELKYADHSAISFGIQSTDPALAMFNATNFPAFLIRSIQCAEPLCAADRPRIRHYSLRSVRPE